MVFAYNCVNNKIAFVIAILPVLTADWTLDDCCLDEMTADWTLERLGILTESYSEYVDRFGRRSNACPQEQVCVPHFLRHSTIAEFLGKYVEQRTLLREIFYGFFIKKSEANCVRVPSICMHGNEIV